MKAKDLAKLLLKNPDFEVEVGITYPDGSDYGLGCLTHKVIGIGDIGYSDKVIRLDVKKIV